VWSWSKRAVKKNSKGRYANQSARVKTDFSPLGGEIYSAGACRSHGVATLKLKHQVVNIYVCMEAALRGARAAMPLSSARSLMGAECFLSFSPLSSAESKRIVPCVISGGKHFLFAFSLICDLHTGRANVETIKPLVQINVLPCAVHSCRVLA
jgi:hypothetical protein